MNAKQTAALKRLNAKKRKASAVFVPSQAKLDALESIKKARIVPAKKAKAPLPKNLRPPVLRRQNAGVPAYDSATDSDSMSEYEDEKERKELLAKVTKAFAMDQTILTCDVNLDAMDKFADMSNDELRMRYAKFEAGKLDDFSEKATIPAIEILDGLVGRVLGIQEELRAINKDDKLLKKSTKAVLSKHIWKLSPRVRTAALYLFNMTRAMGQKLQKKLAARAKKKEVPNHPAPKGAH